MSAPARAGFRPVPERLPTFPVIDRRTTEPRQRGQITYLFWRLDMLFKDYGATKEQRQAFKRVKNDWARTGNYVATCSAIEKVTNAYVLHLLNKIQSIYDER